MAKKRILLGTIPDIRREMATLYREARYKQIDSSEAHRLTMILKEIVKAVEVDNSINPDKGKENWTQQVTIYGMSKDAI